jgi:DNA polymerase-3 subunit chi
MTEVAFHFNVPDKMAYLCRLLRKAVNAGAKVAVIGDEATLAELDALLWTFAPHEFLAHCMADAEAHLLASSPIVLGPNVAAPGLATWHHQVLLNLGPEVPEGFERYQRLIEVVSMDADDRLAARSRWKHYASGGHPLVRHDQAPQASANSST